MRILIYTDPHWCAFSSIVRSRGSKYTTRLENEIQSINWAEQVALQKKCDSVFCLGDFFDTEFLKSEELTALNDIQWSGLSHLCIVGNHEMGRSSLEFSSMHLFNMIPNVTVIDKPQLFHAEDYELCFLPYVLESTGKKMADFFEPQISSKRFIFSHNDLKGIQMGSFISTGGFEIEDIEENCTLFINGHLHNGMPITKKVINLGNLTGQNFSEDANKYSHNVAILDTSTCQLEFIENPYAFNFYKLDLVGNIFNAPTILHNLKTNAVVSLKCYVEDAETIRNIINDSCSNILEYRIVVEKKPSNEVSSIKDDFKFDFSTDHLKQFNEFILNELGDNEVVKAELLEVTK